MLRRRSGTTPADSGADDVAVVGLSCRFPGVDGPEEFWRLLVEGRSTVGTFPAHRAAELRSPTHQDTRTLSWGSFLEAVDGFDAEFFGMGAAEAAAVDPAHRLGLELAWEAVEDARVAAGALAGSEVDVLVGTAPSGYDVLRRDAGSDRDDHYAALGSAGTLLANRVSALFDLRGLSLCIDSGQSSSLAATVLACERLRAGAVGTALVGGVNVVADPDTGLGLANLGALSADGRCSAFDERADGFVRGEGGGFVVLKRLDLAAADGDHVYAVVRGWAARSGGSSSRIPDPSSCAQAATVREALTRAGLDLADVDYVEAHGTGTRLGDPAELAGLRGVGRESGRRRPLRVGSVKTNVGHLEPAAGIVGLVKTVLCLDRAVLVPSLNFRVPNPAVADFGADFAVPVEPEPWPGASDRVRRAGVSSFGMGGTNAHVVLERRAGARDASRFTADDGPSDTPAVLPYVLSARSGPALVEQAARVRDLLAGDPPPSAADVAYSLATTRSAFAHRAVLLGADREEAVAGLDALVAGARPGRGARGEVPRPAGATGGVGPVVFVFPGQGSQWVGMGRRLYAESRAFAQGLEECARALEPWVDFSVVDVVAGPDAAYSLDRVEVVQPVLFAVLVSLARHWRSLGVVPDVVVGHSQGEIAAAHVAGALSLEDAARVAALRSRALRGLAGSGGMSAVAASERWVREQVRPWSGRLDVAAVNGPTSVVVSGDGEALGEFTATATGHGVRVRRIPVDYASHTARVERVRDLLLTDLDGLSPRTSAVVFHSTVTGGPLETRALDGAYWYENLRSPVRFGEVVGDLVRAGAAAFVEVSPHPVLDVALAETVDAAAASSSVVGTLHRHDAGASRVLASLAELHVRGVPVDWGSVFADRDVRRIALPTYPFQRERHWLRAAEEPPESGAPIGEPCAPTAVAGLVHAEVAALLSGTGVAVAAVDVAARDTESFKDLGFDSSMAVQLRNRVAAGAGVALPATVAFTHATPRRLAHHVVSVLVPAAPDVPAPAEDHGAPEGVEPAGAPAASDDEIYALIDRGYV